MRKKIYMLTAILTLAAMPACEKDVFSEFDEDVMRSYYHESCVLPKQTTDSIKSFSQKVESYVTIYPEAEESEYYAEIINNIESACSTLCIEIKIDTTWAGHIYVRF